jgi:hypothetical protein
MDWLWTWGGTCFGYRDGDDLWTHGGKHVGRFEGEKSLVPIMAQSLSGGNDAIALLK